MDGDIYGCIPSYSDSQRQTDQPGGSGRFFPSKRTIRAVDGFREPRINDDLARAAAPQDGSGVSSPGGVGSWIFWSLIASGGGDVQFPRAVGQVSGAVIVTTPRRWRWRIVRVDMFRHTPGSWEYDGSMFRGSEERVAKDFQVPFLRIFRLMRRSVRGCRRPIVAA